MGGWQPYHNLKLKGTKRQRKKWLKQGLSNYLELAKVNPMPFDAGVVERIVKKIATGDY